MDRLVKSFGDYVADFRWCHWFTGTPASLNCSPHRLKAFFEGVFVRRLEHGAQQRVCWIHSIERSPGGIFHVHAVMSGTDRLVTSYIAKRWSFGRADVDLYDPTRGAAWYLAKYYGDDRAHWEQFDCSWRMPERVGRDAA